MKLISSWRSSTVKPLLKFKNKCCDFVLELFAITIGVLLATCVDDWRSHRADVFAERQYLSDMIADLDSNISILETREQQASLVYEEKKKVKLSFSDPLASCDSASRSLQTMLDLYWEFSPTKTLKNQLDYTGEYHIIRNDSIRSEFIDLYEMYSTLEELDDLYNDKRNETKDYISKYVSDIKSIRPDEYCQLTNDNVFRNKVTMNYAGQRLSLIKRCRFKTILLKDKVTKTISQ